IQAASPCGASRLPSPPASPVAGWITISPVSAFWVCSFHSGSVDQSPAARWIRVWLPLKALREQVAKSERPLVVAEGKTDWKHLKAALVRLKAGGDYAGL